MDSAVTGIGRVALGGARATFTGSPGRLPHVVRHDAQSRALCWDPSRVTDIWGPGGTGPRVGGRVES